VDLDEESFDAVAPTTALYRAVNIEYCIKISFVESHKLMYTLMKNVPVSINPWPHFGPRTSSHKISVIG